MTLQQAILILKHHNAWRRGDTDEPLHTPKEIGGAIDMVVEFIEMDDAPCPMCGKGKLNYKFTMHYFKCSNCKESFTNHPD